MIRIFFLLLLLPFGGYAQQESHFSTDGFSSFWQNPATSGTLDKLSFNFLGRLQWVGVESAPQTFMFNSSGRLELNQLKNKSLEDRIGVGVNLIGEQVGFQNKWVFQVPLNYQFKLGETYLSAGLSVGFRAIIMSNDWVPPQTLFDPLLPGDVSGTVFNMDAGLFWYAENFYAGISSTQLTEANSGGLHMVRHYHVQGAYKFAVGQHYIYPQLQIIANSGGVGFWNLNYFQFKDDIFSIGAGVGAGYDLLLAATFRYKIFKIAYNFEYHTGSLSEYTKGSHELRLTFAWK